MAVAGAGVEGGLSKVERQGVVAAALFVGRGLSVVRGFALGPAIGIRPGLAELAITVVDATFAAEELHAGRSHAGRSADRMAPGR